MDRQQPGHASPNLRKSSSRFIFSVTVSSPFALSNLAEPASGSHGCGRCIPRRYLGVRRSRYSAVTSRSQSASWWFGSLILSTISSHQWVDGSRPLIPRYMSSDETACLYNTSYSGLGRSSSSSPRSSALTSSASQISLVGLFVAGRLRGLAGPMFAGVIAAPGAGAPSSSSRCDVSSCSEPPRSWLSAWSSEADIVGALDTPAMRD
mmetsp:Transcript_15290/g.39327  ORF Transcript_15290/g.39327 Transcript_15290/m.39327 type:complete len:207 (-) Transcript_15290:20-640(-)